MVLIHHFIASIIALKVDIGTLRDYIATHPLVKTVFAMLGGPHAEDAARMLGQLSKNGMSYKE